LALLLRGLAVFTWALAALTLVPLASACVKREEKMIFADPALVREAS